MTGPGHGASDLGSTPAPTRDLVAGAWRACTGDIDLVLEDPATGRPLRPARGSSPERVEDALAAAAALASTGEWAAAGTRADILDAVADALEPALPEITALEAFATGVPITQTTPLGMIVTGSFRLAAARLRAGVLRGEHPGPAGRAVEIHRRPRGPALCLVPWNAPAPMAAHKAASALGAGCPVMVKPSEFAPYGTQLLAEVLAGVLADHGAPPATFQLLHGDARTGAALAEDARVAAVSFTGGTAAGRSVATACAGRFAPAQLELGGCNPLLIMPDADVDAAARAVVDLLTTLNGQWCRALGRLIVPSHLDGPLMRAVADELAGLRVGAPLDTDTDFGPLVHSAHRDRLRAAIAGLTDAGGTAHSWTEVPEHGNHLAPTLITGVPSEAALREVFGPVATVHTYPCTGPGDRASTAHGIALADAGPYGLEGYVWGTDEPWALSAAREIRTGETKVNGSSVLSLHPDAPRPAWGRSGLGDEGTDETLLFFTGAQVVGVEGGHALHRRGPTTGGRP
ncbi:aldehyde dehydrogenase [Embleya scabrispora]|uniref:Aldehyde dehydrogenase n=1 Tax=Embleya scabrispora TaxID=159449 RepID=A0A1T3NSL4_9ACTN|nr:aldehyde dehydrogenase family protein [Embleya scabrispora]OPC79672.1 aldehyde dehydrogenase [Embleya scabrispora]